MVSLDVPRRYAIGAVRIVRPDPASGSKWASAGGLLYDLTRDLYREIDPAFIAAWQKQIDDHATANQSHGASGAQWREVLEGLQAPML